MDWRIFFFLNDIFVLLQKNMDYVVQPGFKKYLR